MNAPNTSPLHLDFLDGIRGWAALMVVFSHLFICLFPKILPVLTGPWFRFISDGGLAVYIFFVLSGFALSIGPLSRGRAKPFAAAVLSRYVRLLIPILVTSFLVLLLLKAGWMFHRAAIPIVGDTEWLSRFYVLTPSLSGMLQFSFWGVFYGDSSYNSSLWTMAWEITGSLLVYVLLWARTRQPRALWPVAVLLLLASLTVDAAVWQSARLSASLQSQAWLLYLHGAGAVPSFLTGYAMAWLYAHRRAPRYRTIIGMAGAGGVIALVTVLSRGMELALIPLSLALWSLASVFVGSVLLAFPLQRFFSLPLSRWLGHISFPLYLVHISVLCSLGCWLIVRVDAAGYGPVAMVSIVSAAVLGVSLLLAHLLQPMERASIRASRWVSR